MKSDHEIELKDLRTKLTEESENSTSNVKQKNELKLASLKVIDQTLN